MIAVMSTNIIYMLLFFLMYSDIKKLKIIFKMHNVLINKSLVLLVSRIYVRTLCFYIQTKITNIKKKKFKYFVRKSCFIICTLCMYIVYVRLFIMIITRT